MKAALSAIAVGALGGAALLVLATDPERPIAVAALVLALALAAGAGAARLLLMRTSAGRRRGQSQAEVRALRRGAEVGAVVALLISLRVIDGLTPITAAFVVLAFTLAEAALTVRAS